MTFDTIGFLGIFNKVIGAIIIITLILTQNYNFFILSIAICFIICGHLNSIHAEIINKEVNK